MKKQILTFFLFFFFAFGWCQNIEFYVIDSETQSPVSNTKILITDYQLKFSKTLTTNIDGYTKFELNDSIIQYDSLNIKIISERHGTSNFKIYTQNKNTRYIYSLIGLRTCNFQPLIVNFNYGKVEPDDDSRILLDELVHILKENQNIDFLIHITYSKNEKRGVKLSNKRLEYISNYFSEFGLNEKNYTFKISEGEKSELTIAILKFN